LRLAFLVIPLALACFALSPGAQAVSPPPDGGYPNGNTAEGNNALLNLTTGTFNTAVGLFSLVLNTQGESNAGVGASALPNNTSGNQNTAVGADALNRNQIGLSNNLRVVIGLFVALVSILLALLGFGTFSNASALPNLDPNAQEGGQMKVMRAVHSDLSPRLRDQPVVWQQEGQEREPHVNPRLPIRRHDRPDPVIQSSYSEQLMRTLAIPAPTRQWAGVGQECEACLGVPDTNAAVGETQYVEMVNKALQVFDKLTGTSLLGPIPIESIFTGFGGPCSIHGNGDPIVVYDRLADRWVISQFATRPGAIDPQDECIAVSQTGDATGAWYRYDFHLTFRFSDYPKFGVWPDGYYMSANMFRSDPPEVNPIGAKPFVFDRAKMLVGDPTATVQTTEEVTSVF
jgi:hypothetical protein